MENAIGAYLLGFATGGIDGYQEESGDSLIIYHPTYSGYLKVLFESFLCPHFQSQGIEMKVEGEMFNYSRDRGGKYLVNSLDLVEWLKEHGFSEAGINFERLAQAIPPNHKALFYRGIFDARGAFSIETRAGRKSLYPIISIENWDEDFLRQLAEKLVEDLGGDKMEVGEKGGKSVLYRLRFRGERALRFLDLVYANHRRYTDEWDNPMVNLGLLREIIRKLKEKGLIDQVPSLVVWAERKSL